ncbi:MAG: DUF3800 domain-containing protein [Candidatus Saccharibacteria bacterium]|nr:DUF3800 domain-containing protein [Candidatus Saccharibacteria bacterium]
MSCLSIFVDESGDFGPYDSKSPYYIVTLIIHDQSKDISKQVQILNDKVQSFGFDNDFVIHTAPLIRREEVFANESPNKRRSLFISLFFFVMKSPISYKTFVFEKRQGETTLALEGRMAREMSLFIRQNLALFQKFEDVVLYYDNGQHELNRILNYILSTELSSYTLRKVLPKDYKLFQVADLICTLQLLSLKCESGELSKSEQLIFHSKRELRKTFLGPIQKKRFNKFS